jgi:hypothetical protein
MVAFLVEYWPIVVALIPAVEAFLGALPNNWIPYRSRILKVLKAVEEL